MTSPLSRGRGVTAARRAETNFEAGLDERFETMVTHLAPVEG
jgi:hypothetical protein